MGVTHAVRGRFGPTSSSLAVVFARKNSLDIYFVRANAEMARLELLQSTPLGANVFTMAVSRRGTQDLLCVGFDRMRIALMSWNHDVRGWVTDQLLDLGTLLGSKLCSPSSIMRSLDPEDFGRPLLRGTVGDSGEPLIRTDPSGRCIAVLSKNQNALYIVPLRPEDDQTRAEERVVSKAEVFLIDIPTEYDATNIKDFTFLEGTFEPNILILHEPKRTWAGRAAVQRNTCHLLNLSVDIRSKRHTKSWAMDTLAYDSAKVVAVPESAGGGALLLAASVILQVRHGACVAGLSLNCFGDAYATEVKGKYDMITASDTLVECDAAHCRFLDYEERVPESPSESIQCVALLSLKGGELYFLNVAVGSRNTISMKRAGSTVMASEIVPVNERFFVLASRLSDSLLVEYQRSADTAEQTDALSKTKNKAYNGDPSSLSKSKTSKRKRKTRSAENEAEYELIYGVKPPPESSDEDSGDEHGNKQSSLKLEEKDEGTRGVYDDEDELGWVFNSGTDGERSQGKTSGAGTWALKVKDTLPCFGPGADLAIGASPEDLTKLDIVVAGGFAKNGCLGVVHESIRPTSRAEFHVPGCNGVWTLRDLTVAKNEKAEREERNAATSLRNAARRARNTKKHAARKRYLEQAIEELRKERVAQNIAEAKAEEAKVEKARAEKAKAEKARAEKAETEKAEAEKGKSDPESTVNGATGQENGDVVETNSKEPGEGSDGKRPQKVRFAKAEDTVQTPAPEAGAKGLAEPPLKKIKSENGNSASTVDPELSKDTAQIEISEAVRLQIEQGAEAEFPLEPEDPLEEAIAEEGALHSYMLLSTESATTVLKTGLEIEELVNESVDFVTTSKTLAAGNVLENHAVVQVVTSYVKLLKEGKIQCEYKLPDGKGLIRSAQISDPLILLETDQNHVVVLTAKADLVIEGEDDAHKSSAASGEEELFDEYGMVLDDPSASGQIDVASAKKKEAAGKPDAKASDSKSQEVIGYKNFSFGVEFSTLESLEAVGSVSASFLYRGPLADEVASDGILVHGSGAQATKEPTALQADSGEQETEQAKKEKLVAEGVKDEVQEDDDDRMLYGDDSQDEADIELYGTTDQDSNTKDLAMGTSRGGTQWSANMISGADGKAENVIHQEGGINSKSAPPEKGVVALPDPSQIGKGHSHLLIISRSDGALEVLSPSLRWETVLECPSFFAAPPLVKDSPISAEDKEKGNYPFASKDLVINNIAMVELSGSALLPGLSSAVLIAISATGAPMVYRSYMCSKSSTTSHAKSRLSMHRIVCRDRTAHIVTQSVSCCLGGKDNASVESKTSTPKAPIVHFRNIAGRAGVFVGGPCPFFLFAERGYPRMHALSHTSVTGAEVSIEEYETGHKVWGFTEFHNVKCPRGFISVGNDGVVRIAELLPPSVINFDAPTPMRKIALRCTPHKVAYHNGSKTYGVLASMPTLTKREERLARILQSLEKHDRRHYQHTAAQAEAETVDERANRVPPLFEELHELRVYRPDTWELIKSHKLQQGEVGLAIANMKVDVYKQKTMASGVDIPSSKKGDDGNESQFAASQKMRPKDMLVVGTGHLNGEDASSRGRLLLFEVSRQDLLTDEGGVFTAFQLQLIAEKELFSPVTAVASMEGYVIAGVGPQVSVYKLVGDEIIHLSFAFGQLYCTALASLKQYVVAADMCKSVSFMYFRDRNNSVNFLGKDYEHVTSYAADFLIENENVSIIVSDGNANVQLMNYAHASVPESQGGKRLLINGGVQFGSRINKFVRTRAPDRRTDLETGRAKKKSGRHVLLFSTLDGGIGALVAVNEVEFRNLKRIRDELVEHPGIVRHAGANPLEQTAFRPETASTVVLQQHLLDSRSMFDLFSLSLVEMRMIARQTETDLGGLARTLMTMDSVLYKF